MPLHGALGSRRAALAEGVVVEALQHDGAVVAQHQADGAQMVAHQALGGGGAVAEDLHQGHAGHIAAGLGGGVLQHDLDIAQIQRAHGSAAALVDALVAGAIRPVEEPGDLAVVTDPPGLLLGRVSDLATAGQAGGLADGRGEDLVAMGVVGVAHVGGPDLHPGQRMRAVAAVFASAAQPRPQPRCRRCG